jgi:dTDP-4-amino-4,6-dideoxygalactose transaminase
MLSQCVSWQLPYLEEHIAQKKKIYERYKQGFADLPSDNPYEQQTVSELLASCIIIDKVAMCPQAKMTTRRFIDRNEADCPTEIL